LETQQMRKPKAEYAIQTVINATRLLEAFRDEDVLGVTELSRRLGLHKNNVFRLLATLEQEGYIEQCADSERYRLGVRNLELGQSFARSRPLLRCARAVLEGLARSTAETAHLGAMQDFEVVHLDGIQTERMVMSGLRVGRRLPLHCTALGKVLLGGSPEEVRQAYDQRLGPDEKLERRTGSTIVDAQKFFEHLRTAAVRGFALDLGECEDGLCCAAAPVFDVGGRVVAALSVSGPAFRLGEDHLLDEVVPQVVAAGERLSRDLGYAA
jgi:DNA-binding IclR family transcriptional regulator